MKRRALETDRVHLYLSYAANDAKFALTLATDLLCAGMPAWIDRLHADLEHWNHDVHEALNKCAILVAVLSPEYVQSPYVLNELRLAIKRKVPILPVLCTPVERAQWLGELQSTKLIDFTQWHDRQAYAERLGALLNGLRERLGEPTEPDAETRYLYALMGRLEARKPLTQFLNLASDERSAEPTTRAPLRISASWGTNVPLYIRDAESQRPQPIASLSAALERYPQFVLTGTTGSGKTTVLERFVLDAALRRLRAGRAVPLPLYIDLGRWKAGETVETFIQRCATFDGESLITLTPWEVILCLDHLDELGGEGADKVAQLQRWLASDAAPRQAIIACRQADALLQLDLPRVELGELGQEQIRAYVLATLDDADADALFEQFFPSKPESQARAVALCGLARTMAMLAGLVFLFKSSPQGELPLNPGALLKRYYANYWIWQRRSSMPGWMPYKELEAGLYAVARALLVGADPLHTTYANAVTLMGDERNLSAAIAGGLLELTDDHLRFQNRSALEYFAAVGLSLSDLVLRLMEARFDLSGLRIAQRWDGVVMLMSGMLASPDALVRAVAEIDPYLAGRCLASGARVSDQLQAQLISTLQELATDPLNRGRVEAAVILRAVAPRDGGNALIEIMRGASWDERCAASRALTQGDVMLPAALFEQLRAWNWRPDERAAAALRSAGADALPLLLNLLSEANSVHRQGAVWGLSVLNDCAALPGLIDMLGDADIHVCIEAARALGHLKDTAALPFLTPLLQDARWEIREVVAAAVDVIDAPKVLHLAPEHLPADGSGAGATLLDALNHESWQVRCSAVEALAKIDDSSTVPALLEALHDEDARVRFAVIKALELHPDPVVIDALTSALEDTEALVAETAAQVLERVQPVEAPLTGVDEDLPFSEQQIAQWEGLHTALERMAGADWHKRREAAHELREQAKHLRGIADRHIVDLLVNELANDDYVVRWAVVEALAWIKDASVVPNMMILLRDSSWTVRTAVIRALVEIGDQAAIPALRGSLEDEHPMVRETAVEALGWLRAESALPKLTEMLRDPEPFVRRAAAVAVGTIREAGLAGIQSLIAALDDHDPQVRWAAAESLGVLRDAAAVTALIRRLNDTLVPMWETRRICDVVAEALLAIGDPEGLTAVELWRLGRLN